MHGTVMYIIFVPRTLPRQYKSSDCADVIAAEIHRLRLMDNILANVA